MRLVGSEVEVAVARQVEQNRPALAVTLGARDVRGGGDLRDEVRVLAEPLLPAHHVLHRAAEAFPDRTGAVRGR